MHSKCTARTHARGGWTVGLLILVLGLQDVMATETLAQRVAGIATYRCGACHGPGGQGANPIFPKLAGQNPEYLVQQILNFKSGARKGQVMFYQLGDLSAADATALAAYFNRQQVIPATIGDKTLHEAGRKLYFEGNSMSAVTACVTCHGATARGSGYMPRMAGQHAEYIAEQIYRFIDSDRLPGQSQRHPAGLVLTHDEIRAVSLFLSAME